MAPTPARPSGTRVLVVEDDPQVADLIHGVLRSAPLRLRTEQASSLLRARRALKAELPQLLVLDMALPDGLGLELLMALRADERTRRLPVLVQTGSVAEKLSVKCLEDGADDFIEKPFAPEELLARVTALLRRSGWRAEDESVFTWGPLTLDQPARRAWRGEALLKLTGHEFDILAALMKAQGAVVGTETLLGLLGASFPEPGFKVDAGRVHTHVFNLREKLGEDGPLIESVHGVGFRLVEPS